jgi:hypothetical protein
MLRREQLCHPNLCHDSPGPGKRCDHCPLDDLDNALSSSTGQLVQRAWDLRSMRNVGLQITLDDIRADELYALLTIEEEQSKLEKERPQRE